MASRVAALPAAAEGMKKTDGPCLVGRQPALDVEAGDVRQLFARLKEIYPELALHLERGSAVAIDGQIYQDALLQPIARDSEVHILPQIAGG
jgi:sulfur-carrier protein